MDDQRREVEREAVLDAPAGEVWEALTDERLLGEWLADEAGLDPEPGGRGGFRFAAGRGLAAGAELDPEPGGRARFRFADGTEREGTVLRVEEERELAFTWSRPGEPETEVELTLVPLVSGTRLVVVERAGAATPTALAGAAWGARLTAFQLALSLVLA